MTCRFEKHCRQTILVVFKVERDQNREVVAKGGAVTGEYPTDFFVDDLCKHLPCDLTHHVDNTVTTCIIPVILNDFQTRWSVSKISKGGEDTRRRTLLD